MFKKILFHGIYVRALVADTLRDAQKALLERGLLVRDVETKEGICLLRVVSKNNPYKFRRPILAKIGRLSS